MTTEELKEMIESMPSDYLALTFIGKGTEFPYLPDIVSTSGVELNGCYYYKIDLRYPEWIDCKGLIFYYSKPKNTLNIKWLVPFLTKPEISIYGIAMDKIRDYFRLLGFKVLDNTSICSL